MTTPHYRKKDLPDIVAGWVQAQMGNITDVLRKLVHARCLDRHDSSTLKTADTHVLNQQADTQESGLEVKTCKQGLACESEYCSVR